MAKKQTPKSPAPDAEYIMSLYRFKINDSDEARLIRLAWEFRRLTRLTHAIRIPEAYKAITKEVRTPYVRDTWHRAVASLNQKPYVIHIEPRDSKQDTDRAANIGERWDTAVRESLDKEINQDTSIESSKALIRDGESVLKAVHRPDAWARFPRREAGEKAEDYLERTGKYKKGAPVPFAWRVVDRLTTVWEDGEFGDNWVIEFGEYERAYLKRRYGMVENSDGYLTSPSAVPNPVNLDWMKEGNVTPENILQGTPKPFGWLNTSFGHALKVEYFDDEWWAVVINGTMAPGFPKPNPYAPRLPYFRAKGPDSESLLYSLLFLVPALDELLTMKLNWAHLGAYPTPVVKAVANAPGSMPLGEDGSPPALVWTPGKAMTFPAGWGMDFLQPPPTGQDMNQLIQILQSLIDIAGIPSVYRGVGGADQAGYAINQLMAAASLAFRLASEAQSRQFSRAFEFFHYCIEHLIKQPVFVLAGPRADNTGKQWISLKPGEGINATEAGVDELGPVTIEYRATLPTDEQARAMIAMQLVNAPKPLLSRRLAIQKYLQEEDPEGILDEIAAEQAMEQEPLHSMVVQEALKRAGLLPPQPQGPPEQGPPGQGSPGMPSPNDAGNSGQPTVPGLTQPLQPAPPNPAGTGAGAYPGLPGTPSQTAGV